MAKNQRSKQQSFQQKSFRRELAFGGSLLKNSNAKTKRPISTKNPMHVVMRSTLARGEWSMRSNKNLRRVNRLIESEAKRLGIKLHRYANVGNHLHLLVKLGHRRQLAYFLRSLSGKLAMLLTGARKGERLGAKFWDRRPFSRVVESKRGYVTAFEYVEMNEFEAEGIIPPRWADPP